MNILISCPGRRVRIIEMLQAEFAKAGLGVITIGNSSLIPALYAADRSYLVPSLHDPLYIPRVLEICRQDGVQGIISMLDEDVMVLSQALQEFRDIGVVPLVCDFECARICDNKWLTYQFLTARGFNCPPTYISLEDFTAAHERGEIHFPVFIKPAVSTGSRGAMPCQTMEELNLHWSLKEDLIIQEYMDGPEFSLDTYIDAISHRMVAVFCKQKIAALNGTYIKAWSMKDPELFALVEELALSVGAIGALDIEIFKVRGEYWVCEINARMGGGYFTAQECGVNFAPLIINNIRGIANEPVIGDYEEGTLLLRYDRVITVPPERRLS